MTSKVRPWAMSKLCMKNEKKLVFRTHELDANPLFLEFMNLQVEFTILSKREAYAREEKA